MDNLTHEFLAESVEGLNRMEQCLTDLESRPGDAELLAEIFRCVHTIKGTTGFLGFSRLEKLAHSGEHLLSALRDGRLAVDSLVIGVLLELADGLRMIVQLIAQSGSEGERTVGEDEELIQSLVSLCPASAANTSDRAAAGAAGRGPGTQKPDEPISPDTASQTFQGERTLRIDVEVLDRMMNLVGDLVLTRNQLLQSHVDAENFPQLARRLDSITAELRGTVMQARMQPVGTLFAKFPRMVRDLARTCGKHVRVEFAGRETGLDKNLLEAIKDPLTHAVRNAVDHGIEGPGERLLKGKLSEGLITLSARHRNGTVTVEIKDDGAGIALDRVLSKAVEKGLITQESAAKMSERDALELIFLPGFSTASNITTVSGRGVGMDVVRANVEKVGGSIDVESTPGAGTCLRMRVPLTLAIIPALVVQSGDQSFCLPQGCLAELLYVPERDVVSSIQTVGNAQLYKLRSTLLSIVWLDKLLQLSKSKSPTQGFYLAVLESDGCRYGLAVDEIFAPEEIVVKPLSRALREIGLFSGATVLGNGTLALILDVGALAVKAGIESQDADATQVTAPKLQLEDGRQSFVVFEGGGAVKRGTALPISSVERIEKVPVSQVDYVGGQTVLQYRGELILLEDPSNLLTGVVCSGPSSLMTLLICCRERDSAVQRSSERVQRVAILVERVLDVTDGHSVQREDDVFEGRLAVIGGRVVLVNGFPEVPDTLQEVA